MPDFGRTWDTIDQYSAEPGPPALLLTVDVSHTVLSCCTVVNGYLEARAAFNASNVHAKHTQTHPNTRQRHEQQRNSSSAAAAERTLKGAGCTVAN